MVCFDIPHPAGDLFAVLEPGNFSLCLLEPVLGLPNAPRKPRPPRPQTIRIRVLIFHMREGEVHLGESLMELGPGPMLSRSHDLGLLELGELLPMGLGTGFEVMDQVPGLPFAVRVHSAVWNDLLVSKGAQSALHGLLLFDQGANLAREHPYGWEGHFGGHGRGRVPHHTEPTLKVFGHRGKADIVGG